jgi:hypothetical protein
MNLRARIAYPLASWPAVGALSERWSGWSPWPRRAQLLGLQALVPIGIAGVTWVAVTFLHPASTTCSRACSLGINLASSAVVAALGLLAFALRTRAYVLRRYLQTARTAPEQLVWPLGRGPGLHEIARRRDLCRDLVHELRIDGRNVPAVTGDAGSGKTTLMASLAAELAGRGAVPVYVPLRNQRYPFELRKLARDCFLRQVEGRLTSEAAGDRLWRYIWRWRLVVILADGLDEAVGNTDVLDATELAAGVIDAEGRRPGRVVVSSRPGAIGLGYTVFALEPLDQEESVKLIEARAKALGGPGRRGSSGTGAVATKQAKAAVELTPNAGQIAESLDVAAAPFYLRIVSRLLDMGCARDVLEAGEVREAGEALHRVDRSRDAVRGDLIGRYVRASLRYRAHELSGAAGEQIDQLAKLALGMSRAGDLAFVCVDSEPPGEPRSPSAEATVIADGRRLEFIANARGDQQKLRFAHPLLQAYLASLRLSGSESENAWSSLTWRDVADGAGEQGDGAHEAQPPAGDGGVARLPRGEDGASTAIAREELVPEAGPSDDASTALAPPERTVLEASDGDRPTISDELLEALVFASTGDRREEISQRARELLLEWARFAREREDKREALRLLAFAARVIATDDRPETDDLFEEISAAWSSREPDESGQIQVEPQDAADRRGDVRVALVAAVAELCRSHAGTRAADNGYKFLWDLGDGQGYAVAWRVVETFARAGSAGYDSIQKAVQDLIEVSLATAPSEVENLKRLSMLAKFLPSTVARHAGEAARLLAELDDPSDASRAGHNKTAPGERSKDLTQLVAVVRETAATDERRDDKRRALVEGMQNAATMAETASKHLDKLIALVRQMTEQDIGIGTEASLFQGFKYAAPLPGAHTLAVRLLDLLGKSAEQSGDARPQSVQPGVEPESDSTQQPPSSGAEAPAPPTSETRAEASTLGAQTGAELSTPEAEGCTEASAQPAKAGRQRGDRRAKFWYSRLNGYQALALLRINEASDGGGTRLLLDGNRLLEEQAREEEHKFAQAAAQLCARALGAAAQGFYRRARSFIWDDEALAVSRSSAQLRPSASRLLADIVLELNMNEQDRVEGIRMKRVDGRLARDAAGKFIPKEAGDRVGTSNELPACLSCLANRDRILDSTQDDACVADTQESCLCEFLLCPYEASRADVGGAYRSLSRAFCRHQGRLALQRRRSFLRRRDESGRLSWQEDITAETLADFWRRMESRADQPN